MMARRQSRSSDGAPGRILSFPDQDNLGSKSVRGTNQVTKVRLLGDIKQE